MLTRFSFVRRVRAARERELTRISVVRAAHDATPGPASGAVGSLTAAHRIPRMRRPESLPKSARSSVPAVGAPNAPVHGPATRDAPPSIGSRSPS